VSYSFDMAALLVTFKVGALCTALILWPTLLEDVICHVLSSNCLLDC